MTDLTLISLKISLRERKSMLVFMRGAGDEKETENLRELPAKLGA